MTEEGGEHEDIISNSTTAWSHPLIWIVVMQGSKQLPYNGSNGIVGWSRAAIWKGRRRKEKALEKYMKKENGHHSAENGWKWKWKVSLIVFLHN